MKNIKKNLIPADCDAACAGAAGGDPCLKGSSAGRFGLMQSQLSLQRFMQPGYLASQVARTSSRRDRAVCSSGAWQNVFRSLAKAFLSLSATYFSVLRTTCTMHGWYFARGYAAAMASLMPLRPSAQITKMSCTPRFWLEAALQL